MFLRHFFIHKLLFFSTLFFSGCFFEKNPSVFFVNLSDGDIVKSPFKIKFGVNGYEVRPAGEIKNKTGHHHLLINKKSIIEGAVIPSDKSHIHFGNGQIEAELNLAPGNYFLTLQFGNGIHRSYGNELSSSINVIVK